MCQFPAAKVAQPSFRHRKQRHTHHCHHCYGRRRARLGVLVTFFRGRRARPLPVAGDQGQTMWTSTHGQWKKEVQEEKRQLCGVCAAGVLSVPDIDLSQPPLARGPAHRLHELWHG